ncbi:MAG: hypothetical protein ACE14M_12085 [Terriglobales bacterium]
MFLKPRKTSTDPRLRSLLQKAVRRGSVQVVERVAARLDAIGDTAWLRSRTVVITCEECWPLAASLPIDRHLRSKLEILSRVAKASKQKDAAGLGALAYAYREGDTSMLNVVPDERALKVISEALARPKDFFPWAISQSHSVRSTEIIRNAEKYLPVATWQWDKACILATAFLSINAETPTVDAASPLQPTSEFPYWAALDKHTDEGKAALRDLAKPLGATYRQLIWASFYCESALVNQLLPSPWFEAEREWRLTRTGLSWKSATDLWERARLLVRRRLEEEARELRRIVESPVPTGGTASQHSLL